MKKKVIFTLIFLSLSHSQVRAEAPESYSSEAFDESTQDDWAGDFLDDVADGVKEVEHERPKITYDYETIKIGIIAFWQMFTSSSYETFSDFIKNTFGIDLNEQTQTKA